MSDPLFEIHHRITKTDLGRQVYEYERSLMYFDAYGSMYRSIRNGEEFNRLAYTVMGED